MAVTLFPFKEIDPVATAKQFSVFLENKPGRLAQVLSALAREKVNILALSVMDSHEHGVLRFVANDGSATVRALKALNMLHSEQDVLMVELRNQPGALAQVCELLAQEHINIDYAYCSAAGKDGKTLGIFKVSHMDKAVRVLNDSSANTSKRRLENRPPRNRRAYQTPGRKG